MANNSDCNRRVFLATDVILTHTKVDETDGFVGNALWRQFKLTIAIAQGLRLKEAEVEYIVEGSGWIDLELVEHQDVLL